MNKPSPRWAIKLGRKGTALSTLILVHPDGKEEREALIGTEAWRIMSKLAYSINFYAPLEWRPGEPNANADILRLAWGHARFD